MPGSNRRPIGDPRQGEVLYRANVAPPSPTSRWRLRCSLATKRGPCRSRSTTGPRDRCPSTPIRRSRASTSPRSMPLVRSCSTPAPIQAARSPSGSCPSISSSASRCAAPTATATCTCAVVPSPSCSVRCSRRCSQSSHSGVDAWARPPGRLPRSHEGGLATVLGERYLLLTGGTALDGDAKSVLFYDMLSLSGLEGGTLTTVPKSMAAVDGGRALVVIDDEQAVWAELRRWHLGRAGSTRGTRILRPGRRREHGPQPHGHIHRGCDTQRRGHRSCPRDHRRRQPLRRASEHATR